MADRRWESGDLLQKVMEGISNKGKTQKFFFSQTVPEVNLWGLRSSSHDLQMKSDRKNRQIFVLNWVLV